MVDSQEVNDVTLDAAKSLEADLSLDENNNDGELDRFNNISAVHKLDVMSSKQYNRLVVVNLLLILYTFGHVSVLFLCCQTVWKGEKTEKGVRGEDLTYQTCNPADAYLITLYIADLVGRTSLIILAALFVIRVMRASEVHRSEEQGWAVMMLSMTALSYSPGLNLYILHDVLFNKDDPSKWWFRFTSFREFLKEIRAINLWLSSFAQLFYTWACSHSYGIVEGVTERPTRFRFYAPKLFLLLGYSIFRVLLRMQWRLSPSKLPFTTCVAMLSNFRTLHYWPRNDIIEVSAYTAVELIIVGVIIRRIIITANTLKKVEYLKHRAKQLGFRFFVMQNIISYSLFIIADCAIMLLIPRDFSIRFYLDEPHIHMLFNYRFGPIPRMINYATTVMTAYVNLPANSAGLLGWVVPSKKSDDQDREPITLTLHERDDLFNVCHLATTMVLDLQLELFNLSCVAYELKSRKRAVKCMQFLKNKGYKVEHSYIHKQNHTMLLILSRLDRIVIVFRGTTERTQMKLDLKVLMTPLSVVLPTASSDHPALRMRDWKNARIHTGFAEAYRSVSYAINIKIGELLNELQRPILLTGHSLGGSLATICSLDLILQMQTMDVYVATFGSPRCGNLFWRRVYDPLVPAHWRIAMRSDIITTLPRFVYHHVGKRVALTSSGEMFLDPNTIETMLWSSSGLSVSAHRKCEYRDAFLLFCQKYFPGYNPKLPDFMSNLRDDNDSLFNTTVDVDTAGDIPSTSIC